MSETSQSFELKLNYDVPKSITKLIERLDSVMFDENNLKTEDLLFYLSSGLAKSFGVEYAKNSYKTEKSKRLASLFRDILLVMKFINNSFGLFLFYHFITFLRSSFDKSKLKRQQENDKEVNRNIFFGNFDKITDNTFDVEFIELQVKRVNLTEKLGDKLVEAFLHSKEACIHTIRTEYLVEGATHDEKLKTPTKKIEYLYKLLTEQYKDFEFDSKIKVELGIKCVFLLELLDILIDSGLHRTAGKTHSQLRINKKYANDIFSIPSKPKNLPMIVRLAFWKKAKQTKASNLNFGGYKCNKKLNYPAILNHHNKGITVITQKDLVALNFVQSNYYNINHEFLSYFKKNFKEICLKQFASFPDVNFLIKNFEDKTSKTCIIQFLTELLATDTFLLNLLEGSKQNKLNKNIQRQINSRRDYLINHYYNLANTFFGLVYAYILAERFKKYDIYFTIFIDSRGRLYFVSSGAFFGLQSGDLAKSLINLKGNSYNSNNFLAIEQNIDYFSNKHYIDFVNSLKKDKNMFQYLCVERKIPFTTISNDASCSGTSILSGLIGYLNGLVMTNVFVDSNNDLKRKRCIYSYFLRAMEENYPQSVDSLYSVKEKEKKLEDFEMLEKDFERYIESLLKEIKEFLLTREHAKQFVMRKNYSETNKGRLDYFYENVILPLYINRFTDSIEKQQKFLKSFSYYLARWINEVYTITFPEISEFCDFLVEMFKDKQSVTLNSPGNSDFSYYQFLSKTFKLKRPSLQKVRSPDLSVWVQTDKTDVRKLQISLLANFTHYLDSRLVFLVLYKCYINSVVVYPNHYCFYCCPSNKELLLTFYYESFVELLLSPDLINHFLKINFI